MTATQDAPIVRPDVASARLSSLTGLRFIAALLVFLCHVQYLYIFKNESVQSGYSFTTGPAGHLAVSFFFVLSGFVLAWSARATDTTRAFWRRRFFKIAPNHVVIFAATLVLVILAGGVVKLPVVIANLFLVHNWTADLSYSLYAINPVTWSLSVEVWFYLLFPLLILLVRKIRPAHLWRWAIVVGALITLLPALSQPFLPAEPRFLEMSWPELWFLEGSPARALEFGFGMLLARIVQTGRWIRLPVLPAVALTAAGYVASLYTPTAWTLAALFGVPVGLLIAAVAVTDIKGREGWLGSRPMVWLGEISYAFFLLHMTLLFALHGALSGRLVIPGTLYEGHSWGLLGGTVFVLGALLSCILASWLVYAAVERPAMRRWSRARRQPTERAERTDPTAGRAAA